MQYKIQNAIQNTVQYKQYSKKYNIYNTIQRIEYDTILQVP